MELNFNLLIKENRIRSGMTQKALAKKAGLSQGYIAKLESTNRTTNRGEDSSPTLRCLFKIGKAVEKCPYILFICNGDCEICALK
ncbi:helix-turn-helix domain-containing protein [Clostridium botulinum]|uniref:helix-turn-helix domain-containing protein n=1 Tax=Clostridium botulinum TaxID=1491 RepID=UPI0013F08C41|nr:helix-turn-helix domain-containing protein [Clostridium botulinum]MBN3421727.1 hypothetical protein [Clostridium botulinum]MBY6846685.1 helix-turn-helix domain-containing protein [Clostridium botulinum]NEZ80359.1 helix-turn-helix domain-containing protein [Clostridium botulinum]NFA17671.1 helix-turn-helix domain-containing protein [Clostridium botulinum]NFA54311.1 helix-turn-helix domain-containing protein [Clostridium botulinum]